MKSSQKFNNILDTCLEQLLKGETIEQCLQSYPEQAAELEPLLRTVLAVKKASNIEPRAEFRAGASYQFRLALQQKEPERGLRLFGWQSRWATAVIAIVILLLLGTGTVVTANNSMPDEPLYPVKLATEQIRLTLTPSALGKAELCARLADKRIAEIIYLAGKGEPKQVEPVTRRLDTHLAMIASLAAVQRGKGGAILAPEQAGEDTRILTPAPEQAGEDARNVRPQADSRDKLRRKVGTYAIDHPARLRAALKTAPESARSALHQAIDISVAGYERALKAVGKNRNN